MTNAHCAGPFRAAPACRSLKLLGYVFVKLRQPRVIGEILAGVVLGLRCWAGAGHCADHGWRKTPGKHSGFCVLARFAAADVPLRSGDTATVQPRKTSAKWGWLTIVGTDFLSAGTGIRSMADPAVTAGQNGNRASLIIILPWVWRSPRCRWFRRSLPT